VTTSYGQAPYTYSINNGVTYQSSNIFNGLCPNTYTILVKDSAGSTLSKIATLGYDEAPVTYTIGVTLDNIITVDSSQQIANWKVNVTPALPVGTSITFNLNMSDIKQYDRPGTGLIEGTTTVYKNGASIPRNSSNTTSQTTARPNCSPYETITTTTTDVYTVTMGSGDVVSGTSTSILTITEPEVGSNGCATTLVQDILVATSSPVKNGCSCCEVVNNANSVGIVKHTFVAGTTKPPVVIYYELSECTPGTGYAWTKLAPPNPLVAGQLYVLPQLINGDYTQIKYSYTGNVGEFIEPPTNYNGSIQRATNGLTCSS
jgi:hypothetical protein